MLLSILIYCCVGHIIAQSNITFTNLTDVIQLTAMEPIYEYNFWACSVVPYIDMKSMNNYYWIATLKPKGVVSNIYDINKLNQYNDTLNSNLSSSLPFEIGIDDIHQTDHSNMGQCESPSDNNIITCYSDTNAIKCTIFNYTNNTLSSQFTVNHPSVDIYVLSPQVLCKHHEYIIFYLRSIPWVNEQRKYSILYTSLNMAGDILSMDVDLNIQGLEGQGVLALTTQSFNDSIFLIIGASVTQTSVWIGYYDYNENNNSNTIKVIQVPTFTIDLLISYDIITLNVTDNCCFVMIYSQYEIPGYVSMYASTIDIYGNMLFKEEIQYPILDVPLGSTVELKMINNISSNSKYFL
eukprot:334598_1